MPVETLVVVGASLAGLRAVEAARKGGFAGAITLIGAEPYLPYDRPPLSKAFLDPPSSAQPAGPFFRTEQALRDELGVDLILGQPATALDAERREIAVGDRHVRYDSVVIATGSSPRMIEGTGDLGGVYPLRTLDDALAVRAALDNGARTVVIGAGFIGSEVASAARKRGLDVSVIEALPTPLVRATGEAMGHAIAALHERNGTALRCGAGVAALEGSGKAERVLLADGTAIGADLVVVGIGVSPNTDWLRGSGLELDNGIVCDETLWTGVPGVYAAGDVANWCNPMFGERQRMENWTAAAEKGAAAARNALDPEHARAYSTVPYFWSDWYDARIQFVGTPDADEVRLVDRNPDYSGRWVALYRRGDRLTGALTVNGQGEIMKYRGLIMRRASWDDALTFAAQRKALAADRSR